MARARTQTSSRRVGIIDQWRGLMIIGVVIYHILYDLTIIFGVSMPWFTNTIVFRLAPWILAGSFMVISGISSIYSRSNLKRGIYTLLIAIAITVITYYLMPGQIIRFGILHFMGCAMILFCLLWCFLGEIPSTAGVVCSLALFLLTFNIYYTGYIGIPNVAGFYLPDWLYSFKFSYIFGLPSPGFYSADYYPLLPWIFLFFIGAYIGKGIRAGYFPSWFYGHRSGSLAWIGSHTLPIYLIHQPLAYGILWVVFWFVGKF